ncbi:MAG: sulfatase, partial [Gemmataceae bacterium]
LIALPGCGTRPRPADVAEPEPPPAASLPMAYPDHNLVFVSFDALQAAHVGSLGNPRDVTPTLDAFAKRAFSFRRAYSVASWTVPASMTWFTGVYPSEHRMTNKFALYRPPVEKVARLKELAPDLVTLADVLRGAGYATAAFTGNAGVSGGFGYDQGFDRYSFDPGRFGGFDVTVPRALEWLRVNRGRKFFLFLHGYDAHGQNVPEGGLDYRYVEKGYDRRFNGSEAEQEALREEGLEKGRLTLRDADVRFWRAVYDEKISRADERFRRFMAAFDELELTGRTLFVLTSDHGTELYEHRRFDHGFTLYDEQIRVPLFVRLPGQRSAGVIEDRVSSVDVMPTVLGLLGRPVPEQVRGVSLVPALRGGPARRDVISETDYRQYTYKRSLIAPDGWKLICTLETGGRELYYLNVDPGEADDRAAAEPARANELQRRLFAHFADIGHDLTARKWERGMNPVYPSQGKKPPNQ